MRLSLIHALAFFTAFASECSCNDDSYVASEPRIMNFALIKLPEEVKNEIRVPSIMHSWEETEYIMLTNDGTPFEYALNMSYLDLAKLHLLNANSGKFKGNDYAGHQASYKGNLTELTLDDVIYLYYTEDELVLDRSIPFYTRDETKTATGESSPTSKPGSEN